MTHDGTSNLIALEFAQESRRESSFHWWLIGSSGLHVLAVLIAVNVQLSASDPLPIATFDVALVTLSEPEPAQKGRTAPPSSTNKAPQSPTQPPARRETQEPMPDPLPVTPQRERLSESFAGAVRAIRVPPTRNASPIPLPDPAAESASPPPLPAASSPPTALADIELPDVPALQPAQPLASKELGPLAKPVVVPRRSPAAARKPPVAEQKSASPPSEKSTPRTSAEVRELLARLPSAPETPTLQPVQPLSPEKPTTPPPESSDPLSPSIEELVASIPVPSHRSARITKSTTPVTPPIPKRDSTPLLPKAPRLTQVPPPAKRKTPAPPERSRKSKTPRRLTESLQEVLGTVKIPERRALPAPMVRADSTDPRSAALDETGRQTREAIAKIPTPDPLPSLPKTTRQTRETMQEALERIRIPDLAPPRPKIREAPAHTPSPELAMVRKKTQEALERIQIPDLAAITRSPEQHPATQPPEPLQSQRRKSEIDTQLENLPIPDVLPAESIRSRLRVQVVAVPGEEGQRLRGSGALSQGTSSIIHNQYLARVRALIDRQWVAPPLSVSEKDLETIVAFRILRSGEITRLHIEQESGHAYYDAAARRAVQAANPVPPFPKALEAPYLDVHFRFALGK